MFLSATRPSKRLVSTWYILNWLFLIHNQWSYWHFIISLFRLGKCNCRCFDLLTFEKDFWGFALLCFMVPSLTLHVFELYTFKFHVFDPYSFISKFCPYISKPYTLKHHVFEPYIYYSKPCSLIFKSHFFKPYLMGFLYFFNLVLTTSNLCLQNICSISIMLMQCVLNQTSWQTYKNNSCNRKLSCKAIKKKQSEPNNQDQIMWTEYPKLEG